MPDIFINEEFVNQKKAEEIIEWYLRNKNILKSSPRFKWKKNKGIIACPV